MPMTRFDPFRELSVLQDRVNRLFGDAYVRHDDGAVTQATWAPPVDIYETPGHDLVVKAGAVPLTVLASPYRETVTPIMEYVKHMRKDSPRDLIVVYIPEYVVGHWWDQVLHNQSALRLKTRLLYMPSVMVTSVPWQLDSSERVHEVEAHYAPGDVRRGFLE